MRPDKAEVNPLELALDGLNSNQREQVTLPARQAWPVVDFYDPKLVRRMGFESIFLN